jgi:hypothetical protein
MNNEIGIISDVYCEYIKQLIREKRIGSVLKYRDSYCVIKSLLLNDLACCRIDCN